MIFLIIRGVFWRTRYRRVTVITKTEMNKADLVAAAQRRRSDNKHAYTMKLKIVDGTIREITLKN